MREYGSRLWHLGRRFRPPYWLIRILPGTSRAFGPPRRMRSGWELRDRVYPAGDLPSVTCVRPQLHNGADIYWHKVHEMADPVRPYVIRDVRARLLAPWAWVVTEPDIFAFDSSFWGHRHFGSARRWHDVFLRKRPKPRRILAGRVLSLASDFAPFSYGHWLIDSLPRWLLAERAGLRAEDYDKIYLPGPDTPSTRLLLGALGLPSERLITAHAADDLEVESLTATSFPGASGFASNLGREMAVRLQAPGKPRRRLYLSRAGFSRNVINQEALAPVLEEFGFETCRPANDADVIAKCGEASIILGIEGSQCFNALFAPAGGALVVIGPDGFHPLPYMQSIAGAAKLSLHVVGARICDADSNCILQPEALRAALREVTRGMP